MNTEERNTAALEILQSLLGENELGLYARERVEQAVDALNGTEHGEEGSMEQTPEELKAFLEAGTSYDFMQYPKPEWAEGAAKSGLIMQRTKDFGLDYMTYKAGPSFVEYQKPEWAKYETPIMYIGGLPVYFDEGEK